MRRVSVKPIVISPVPSAAVPITTRPVSVKRVGRLRVNWFVIGAVFGVGLSFFLNFVVTVVVTPGYHAVVARLQDVKIIETTSKTAAKPAVVAAAPTQDATITDAKLLQTAAVITTPPPPPVSYPITLALKLGKGDTLMDMLIANRVQTSEAQQVVNALKAKVNPQKLKVGQKISVTLARHETVGDKAAVQELAIKLPNLATIELQRLQTGGYNVAATEHTSTQKSFRGYGKVRSSLFQAGADAQIPAAAMQELVKAFSYDIDFQREIHPGDAVEVLMDRKPAKNGGYSGYGALRYAALTLRGKKYEIFKFKDQYGDYAWFDGKGNSIKKSLLRTPVDAVHITSGFGLRTHPIMGYTKMHRGVDFGASTGTPIMAAGDGVVTFKGWKNGYGNFVTIKHNDKYETAYGHCSRFGKIEVGSRVKQGQVIAYVGMTGMATGPHLHYEVHENNAQVNPVAKQFNMAAGLTGKSLAAFKTAKQSALNELTAFAKGTATVASR